MAPPTQFLSRVTLLCGETVGYFGLVHLFLKVLVHFSKAIFFTWLTFHTVRLIFTSKDKWLKMINDEETRENKVSTSVKFRVGNPVANRHK
jgi:hypothetical protein